MDTLKEILAALTPDEWSALASLVAVVTLFLTVVGGMWLFLRWMGKKALSKPEPMAKSEAVVDAAPAQLPRPKNARGFVGRKDALAQLRAHLQGGENVAITGKAVVHGAGGLGKTTLATEYVSRHGADYELSLWVRADTPANATKSILSDLSFALGKEVPAQQSPEAARVLMLELVASGISALVVFDNVDRFDDIKGLIPDGPKIDLILTTRVSGGFPGYAPLPLDVLDFETENGAAVDLLMQEAERSEDRACARDLAEALGGLPLGLVIAGNLLRGTAESFASYQTRLDEILQSALPEGDDYEGSIVAAVRLSYDRLSDDAKWIVDLFAWWAPEGLDAALITDAPAGPWWENYRGDVTDDLVALAADQTRMALAMQQVKASSLIRAGEAGGYVMHRLTAAALRFGQDEAVAEAAAAILDAQYPAGSDGANLQKNWALCARLTPHALAIWATDRAPKTRAMYFVMNQTGVFLSTQGDEEGTINCYRASHALTKSLTELGPQEEARALGNLAKALSRRHNVEEAIEKIEKAIALNKEHSPQTEDLASRYVQAATILHQAAKTDEMTELKRALGYVELAKGIRRTLFGEASDEMALCWMQEASVKAEMNDLHGAIVALQKALEIFKAGDRALYSAALSNSGAYCLQAGLLRESVAALKLALEICEEIFRPGHSKITITAVWLATALLVQARAGQNPELREMEAKKICLDHGLSFEQMQADAEHLPLTPLIDLPE